MRTPAGFECKFFYGDYYRGHTHEECRLLSSAPNELHWTRDLCSRCQVPRILLANACPNMQMEAQIKKSFLGLKKRVSVQCYCLLSKQIVKEPEIGCGICHPLPPVHINEGDQ